MGCPAEVVIGDNLVFSICCHDPDTGQLTDDDAAPTWRIYEDETGAAIANGTMAKLDDGNTLGFYTELVACTVVAGFEDRKNYTIYIEATVGGDTGGICYTFRAVENSLNTAIPATPTAGSINAYVQRMKWTGVNKMTIAEATGNTIVYKDNDVAEAANVAAAFSTDATTTTRKRLEP